MRRLSLLDRRYPTPEAAAREYAEAAKVPLQVGLTALAERLAGKGILAQDGEQWQITQRPPERPKRTP